MSCVDAGVGLLLQKRVPAVSPPAPAVSQDDSAVLGRSLRLVLLREFGNGVDPVSEAFTEKQQQQKEQKETESLSTESMKQEQRQPKR